ncbi:MAG: hypothetical protein AAEJ57_02730, partial [Opitutales bacterium]
SNTDIGSAVSVNLTSSDVTEATIPSTVTIPANQASVIFSVTAMDDALLDGTQTVTFSSAASGYFDVTDSLNVTDHETLTVTIVADSIAENAGSAATTVMVTRSNTDQNSALTVSLASSDPSEARVPASVIIPANQSSVNIAIDAIDDALLDGTQTAVISSSASNYFGNTDTVEVTDYETVTIVIVADSIAENTGSNATTATVTRSNTDNNLSLTVNLSSSDTTEAAVPASVIISATEASVSFSIAAVDDSLLDGTQSSIIAGSASNYFEITDVLDVADFETLTVTLSKTSFFENDGPGAADATITRSNTDNTAALLVNLASSDTTEATVPASVTIPAGVASVVVAVDAVDDPDNDGTQTVVITASDSLYESVPATASVYDNEQVVVTITPGTIGENVGTGAATGTVTRNVADLSASLTVALTSSDTTEATVPASVVIPAGKRFVTFEIDAVDDLLLDGNQTVTIEAVTALLGRNDTSFVVADHETVTIAIVADAIAENSGTSATTATVIRSNSDNTDALTLTLASGDTSEASVPATVIIPANQTSVSFAIDAIDDNLLDGSQTVTMFVSATGYFGITDTVNVTDFETVKVAVTVDDFLENMGDGATTAT